MSKMSAQQLILSWKDHNCALMTVFENLLKKNIFVDCTLAAEGQYLKAHKMVLSACSSYFELLLSQESEKNPIVILKDVKFQELEAAVNFMYRGEVEICEDRLSAFLEVADSLQIKGLGNNRKLQDSKEKVQSVRSSCAKSASTQRQHSRKEDSYPHSDNAAQSSNVPADDREQIRNNESSSDNQSFQRENSSVLSVSDLNMGSSCRVRKETRRDSDEIKNVQRSPALPSFTSGESLQCEENTIIKSEPETDIFVDVLSDEPDKDFGVDVTMMDDKNDTETVDVLSTKEQDTGYPSEQIKTEESTSENIAGVQSVNRISSEGADWILFDDEQNFSSMFVKEEHGTSASWSQETVVYGVSSEGDGIEPDAETSSTSAGMDSPLLKGTEKPTPSSKHSTATSPPVAGCSLVGIPAEASLLQTTLLPSPKKFACASCKIMFVRLMDLVRHRRSQMCGDLPSISKGELQPNGSSLALSQSFRRTDTKSTKRNSFKCSNCDYVTPYRSYLQRHIAIHTGKKPFKCPHCEYTCRQNSALIVHIRTHTGERTFKCPHCDYASCRNWSLLLHLRTHTGEKPYRCPQCDYACKQKSNLAMHLRTHAQQKPFKCPHCDYASVQKSNVVEHGRIHTQEKPFKCPRCDYASRRKGDLIKHFRIHTGEKPFKCAHCDYASIHKSHLASHVRTHERSV